MISHNHQKRLSIFQKKMIEESIDGALISKKENIFYITGYPSLSSMEREAYVFITNKQAILFHTPFIPPTNVPSGIITIPMSAKNTLPIILNKYFAGATNIGIEKLDLTVAEADRCQELLSQPLRASVDNILKTMRQVKDETEIDEIKKAIQISKHTAQWINEFIHQNNNIGVTEKQLAIQINNIMTVYGADGIAFPTIVAFDEHSASPHHIPTSKRLLPDSVVLVDMGAEVNGYKSDMTRTWCLADSPSPLFLKIEAIVIEAYNTAKEILLKKNVSASDIDSAARNIINATGYGESFIHTTGHGLGLEPHESPSINLTNKEFLRTGMVITIEPGIYLSGKFGYRHEDTFIVGETPPSGQSH
jgi:Xaa-Pro dipeptidase